MPLTKSSVDITQKIIDILSTPANIAAIGYGLKAESIYYGDQELTPDFPAIIVESFTKDRSLTAPRATTRQFQIDLSTNILILYGKVQSSEITKKDAEIIAERVEDVLHSNFTLDGLVVFGFVARVDPGFTRRQSTMIRATRLIWAGRSKHTF